MSETQLKRWYGWLADKPCVGCRSNNVEVSHLRLLISNKTGDPLPRRMGANLWAAIPLCVICHREGATSIHNMGEDLWMMAHGMDHEKLLLLWASWLGAFLNGENP